MTYTIDPKLSDIYRFKLVQPPRAIKANELIFWPGGWVFWLEVGGGESTAQAMEAAPGLILSITR